MHYEQQYGKLQHSHYLYRELSALASSSSGEFFIPDTSSLTPVFFSGFFFLSGSCHHISLQVCPLHSLMFVHSILPLLLLREDII